MARGHAGLLPGRHPLREPRPRLHRRRGRAGHRAGRTGPRPSTSVGSPSSSCSGRSGWPALAPPPRRQAREVAHVERFIERFRYKATKARQVQSRIKTLEKLERIEVPDHRAKVARFGFPPPRRSSRVVAELDDVTVGYDGEARADRRELRPGAGREAGAGRARTAPARPPWCACSWATWPRWRARARSAPTSTSPTSPSTRSRPSISSGPRCRRSRPRPGRRSGTATCARSSAPSGCRATPPTRRWARSRAASRPAWRWPRSCSTRSTCSCWTSPPTTWTCPAATSWRTRSIAYPGTIVLVTHDRYLIREVATALVAVRDGTARFHPGVDEIVLSPHAAPAVPEAAAPSTRRPVRAVPGPSGSGRTPSAAKPGRRPPATSAARWSGWSGTWAGPSTTWPSSSAGWPIPSSTRTASGSRLLVSAHDDAKERAASLMDQWLEAQGALDRAEARFG